MSTTPTIIATKVNANSHSAIVFLGIAGLIAVTNHEKNQPSECAADDRSMVEKVKEYWESNRPIVSRPKSITEIQQELAETFQKKVQLFIDSGTGGQISWGFGMGFCSGYAARKFSKFGAILCGTAFMVMQCASYTGYLSVNYKQMERDISDLFDLNEDGKLDQQDMQKLYRSIMKVLEFSLPAGSGYAAGFLLGFRRG